jgi:hypothetical protein
MRCASGGAFLLVLALTTPLSSRAQPSGEPRQPASPEPILRTGIVPLHVVVGQKTTLWLELLAPNYLTRPPVLPDFQVRNAVTRRLQSLNLNERHDDQTYAGVRFEFAIYPQEAGTYAVADQSISLTYAAEPPKTRQATLSLPRLEFSAFIPGSAAQLDPFLAATSLTIEQPVHYSSDQPRVGDSLTRTISIRADGPPSMLLPPTAFASLDGLVLYLAPPSLQDRVDSRSATLSATRVDAATYLLEKPGDYLLPAIAIRWWNLQAERIETAQVDTIELHVLDNPAATRVAGVKPQLTWNWRGLADFIAEHWALLLIGLGTLLALPWLTARLWQAIIPRWRRRRDIYLASEACAFAGLLTAAWRPRARRVYGALLNWLGRFDPIAPDHTIKALKAAAQDPVVEQQVDALERHLFAPRAGSDDWSVVKLLLALGRTRLRLLRQASRTPAVGSLPARLNPIATAAAARHPGRPIAR